MIAANEERLGRSVVGHGVIPSQFISCYRKGGDWSGWTAPTMGHWPSSGTTPETPPQRTVALLPLALSAGEC